MWDSCQIAELCLRCWGVGLWERCTEELKVHKDASAAVQPDCAGDRTQQHSGRCDRTCLSLCTASCTGDLRLALLFALVPAADPSPAFSPRVPPKIFKNYLYSYFYFIIMRGEHVCTYVSMWRAEDSFRFFLFRGIQDRTQVLRLTRQALSHLAVSMAFSLFLC